jgi:hypothetical protein
MPVSEQLSKFLLSRYNMTEIQTRWLCPRCHAFESKEMMSRQAVQMTDNEVSTDDDENDAMTVEVADKCTTNDDDDGAEELNDEEEDNVQMDSGFLNESKENNDDSLDMDEKSTDCESMDEEEGSVSYEEEYQKHKAMERLSAVFKLLEIEPIHDKYVVNLLRIFINDSYV